MKLIKTIFNDAWILEPKIFNDKRGFFLESYNQKQFVKMGIKQSFIQDNHSCSNKGILRGLHFQNPYTQGKLIQVISGSVYDVIVDIRPKSPTYKKYLGIILSAKNKKILWVPAGFAHGFLTLESNTHFFYKCTEYYHPETEQSLLWNDPDLNIAWPKINTKFIISKKDKQGKKLNQFNFNELP